MLKIGSVLDGKYKILSEIGHGGMSVVYMALNEKANKTWAVKEIRKNGKMDFNVVRQGLVSEIETLKKLKHPSLPSIVDVIEDEDTFIIVMDYIEGNSLDKSLKESGAQSQDDVIEWAKQICNVLGYLHSCKPPIIYRDMKPANIMLKPNGEIALIDFGTAKTYEINLGETTGIGTIGYAAPEQYIGSGLGRTDARTDIYCLGITLYQLLTNIDPCKNVISDKSVRAVNPALSQGLDDIIVKCTQQDPKDRYQSCEELYYALDHYNEVGDAYRRKQKRKLALFSTMVLMSVVCAFVAVFGKVSANKKIKENYESYVEIAKSTDTEGRLDYLKMAIDLTPERTEAYEQLIKLFSEDNKISASESQMLSELKLLNNKPLTALKEKNPGGYSNICFLFGEACWFDYENQSAAYSVGSKWLKEVTDNPIAEAFVKISEQKDNMMEANDRNRVGGQYDAYVELWDGIKNLCDLVETMDTDNRASDDQAEEGDASGNATSIVSGRKITDTKIDCIREIIYEISANITGFVGAEISNDDIKDVLTRAGKQINLLYEDKIYNDELDELKKMADEAAARLDTVAVAQEEIV